MSIDDLALLAFGEDKLREISIEKLQSWEGNDRELDYLLEAVNDFTFNDDKNDK